MMTVVATPVFWFRSNTVDWDDGPLGGAFGATSADELGACSSPPASHPRIKPLEARKATGSDLSIDD